MDACSIDWGITGSWAGAIATAITGGIAIYISNQWRKQKGSEVLSTIALSAYEKTDKLLDSYYKLKDTLLVINQYNLEGLTFKELHEDLNIFIELINSINRDLYLILRGEYSEDIENVKLLYEISKEDMPNYISKNIHQFMDNKQYKSQFFFDEEEEEAERYRDEIKNEIINDEIINIIKNTKNCKDLLSNYILHGLSNNYKNV